MRFQGTVIRVELLDALEIIDVAPEARAAIDKQPAWVPGPADSATS